MNLEKLSAEFGQWCLRQNLPQMSADELLLQVTDPGQRRYLQRFLQRWELAERSVQAVMQDAERTRRAFETDPNPRTAHDALVAVGYLPEHDNGGWYLRDASGEPVSDADLARGMDCYRYAWALIRFLPDVDLESYNGSGRANVKAVEDIDAGGGCAVTMVHLHDGRCIGINEDAAVLYPNLEAFYSEDDPWSAFQRITL